MEHGTKAFARLARGGVGAAVVVAALSAGAAPASGAYITVTANPTPLFLHEGDPGAMEWTIRNVSTSAVHVTAVEHWNQEGYSAVGLKFLSGDTDDQVWNTTFGNLDQALGEIGVNGTRTFLTTFSTRDLSGDNDNDEGVWSYKCFVTITEDIVFQGQSGSAVIHVTDGPVPVPGALALGLVAAPLFARRRR
jgi:hypothetical protein